MNFNAYLQFLNVHHHNFFRLWAWETALNPNAKQGTIRYDPMPYRRSGPGLQRASTMCAERGEQQVSARDIGTLGAG